MVEVATGAYSHLNRGGTIGLKLTAPHAPAHGSGPMTGSFTLTVRS
jgi:hypothetical protein